MSDAIDKALAKFEAVTEHEARERQPDEELIERVGDDRHATLWIGGTPPSYNTLVHAHWRRNHKAKQAWQEWCWLALLKAEVPRGLELVTATAMLHFSQHRRRDEGNFRVVLEKALGDALVKGKWLEDDTPDHYRFERLRFASPSAVAPKTEIGLTFR